MDEVFNAEALQISILDGPERNEATRKRRGPEPHRIVDRTARVRVERLEARVQDARAERVLAAQQHKQELADKLQLLDGIATTQESVPRNGKHIEHAVLLHFLLDKITEINTPHATPHLPYHQFFE